MEVAQQIIQLLMETDSSSSSSSDDSAEEMETENHTRVSNFDVTIEEYSEGDFKKHFRMERGTVTKLINMYYTSDDYMIKFESKGGPTRLTATKEMYLYIWYIANTESFRTISNLFGVANSTAWKVVNRVSCWLISVGHQYIKWPADLRSVSHEFQSKRGFPHVVGAIDCTDIVIKAPRENKEDYFNRKKRYSVEVQAVAGPDKKFYNICCGEPGSMHDSRALRRSLLYRQLYGVGFERNLFILGDSAYPCMEWLIPPFKDIGNLSRMQTKFNKIHSATRIVVEHAFGLLKTRFRRLLHFVEQQNLNFITNIVVSVCILHNFCIDDGDEIVEEIVEDADHEEVEDSRYEYLNDNRRQVLFQEMIDLGILNS